MASDSLLELIFDLLELILDPIADEIWYRKRLKREGYEKVNLSKREIKACEKRNKIRLAIKEDLLKYQKAYDNNTIDRNQYKKACNRLNKQLKLLDKNGYANNTMIMNMQKNIDKRLANKEYYNDPYLNGIKHHSAGEHDWESMNNSSNVSKLDEIYQNNNRIDY